MENISLKPSRTAEMDGISNACGRQLSGANAKLPAGSIVVSADSHWSLNQDIFYERAPRALRDRMPRIWWDDDSGIWNMGIDHVPVFAKSVAGILKSIEDRPGAFELDQRLRDLDSEGVDKEIVFPQSLQFYFHHADLEARKWIFRIYNEYAAELTQGTGGRSFAVGIPNFWDPNDFAASLEHIISLGLKSYQLPIDPGKAEDGSAIKYASDRMEPLWVAADQAGLPVCFHIGEAIGYDGRGAMANAVFNSLGPFRRNFGELVFGGILDLHPTLDIVFAEANLAWVPAALQDAEMVYDSFQQLLDPKPQLRPTEYWQRNCYATFMHDPVGMQLIEYIGPTRIMWGHDYPHNESTMGYTETVLNEIVDHVEADIAKSIIGGTATQLFKLI